MVLKRVSLAFAHLTWGFTMGEGGQMPRPCPQEPSAHHSAMPPFPWTSKFHMGRARGRSGLLLVSPEKAVQQLLGRFP